MDESHIESFVDETTFKKILHYLSSEKALNVNAFKESYLKRRIYFRAIALRLPNINAYWQYLITNEAEVDKFKDLLTVNVTSFFRNPEVFDTLKRYVIPELLEQKQKNKEKFIKILSIGCASGEEPYSVAIMLKENFDQEIKIIKPYILGIDFDSQSINCARLGVYEIQKVANLSDSLKKKYFGIIDNRHCQLSLDIRSMVIFRQDDIFMRDLKKFWDIIFCRNVLIYIKPQSQDVLLTKIIYACREGGYLVLGKSEGLVGKLRSFFFPKYPKERIYVKRRVYES